MRGKVLLISLNQQRFVHPVPPIGALYLAAGLRERGYDVQFVDLMFADDCEGAVRSRLESFRPDVVGISLRNIDSLISRTEYSIPALGRCAEVIRQVSEAPIVLGGPGFTLFARQILTAARLDFGIAGEADESLPLFIERILEGKPYRDVPGLCYRENDRFVTNPPRVVADLDSIPYQAIDLIDARRYNRNRGAMGVFTRKACPMQCVYCPEAAFHGQAVRLRSPEKVAGEIEYIIRQTGVRYFDFADTTFNVPRRHSMVVCEEILKRKLDFRFEVELSPIQQDDESVRLLKRTGCQGVDLTIDSGSNRMLGTLRKGFTTEQALRVARLYRRHGIPYTAGFLLGGPGENRASIAETIEFARSLPDPNAVYFTVGIRVFLQTALYDEMKKRDASLDEDSLLTPAFYVSDDFDDACADMLLGACRENASFYITDVFYKPLMKKVLQTATMFNVRPAWKVGTLPKIVQRIFQPGSDGLAWDNAKRSFV